MKSLLIIILILLNASINFSQSLVIENGAEVNVINTADICVQNGTITGNLTGNGTVCGEPLPVTLMSFTYSVLKNIVGLYWTIEKELNNIGFDVERKITDGNWEKAGFVKGFGTTNEQKKYNYEDKKLKPGKYSYRLKQIDFNGNFEYFMLNEDVLVKPPDKFSISQNYPNPFNPTTKIDFEIPSDSRVNIIVYDILGREVRKLINSELKKTGYYSIDFSANDLASGMYIYRMIANNKDKNLILTKRMVVIK